MPRLPLDENERRTLASFVIAFGVTIVAWAFAHDLHLIRIEPRHFTDYHRPLLPITDHTLLALQYATVATLGPGMLFGAVAFAAARMGRRPRIGLRRAWACFLPFVALIETASLLVGRLARSRHASGEPLPFPAWCYPDETAGIAYSQSVNVTAYLAATVFGALFLVLLFLRRTSRRTRRTNAAGTQHPALRG